MQKNNKNFPGIGGFIWWTGIVEGRNDPLKLGRIRVRCFGWHEEKRTNVQSEELLWAQPVLASNSSQNTHVPKQGDVVFGFFMDGEDAQFPFYLGVIPNIPIKAYWKESQGEKGFQDPGDTKDEKVDARPIPVHVGKPTLYPYDGEGLTETDLDEPTTSRLARNENLEKTPIILSGARKNGFEYNAVYPYISSTMSESGHYFDIDDTPGNERVSILHRSGSFIEFSANGHVRLFASNNLILMANNTVYVEACRQNVSVTARGGISEVANTGNISETAKSGSISENARNSITETAGNVIRETAEAIDNSAGTITDNASLVQHNTPVQITSGIHTDSLGTHGV